MSDLHLITSQRRFGTAAAVSGVLSLLILGLGLLAMGSVIAIPLLVASPVAALLASVLAVVELIRAKRGHASWKESYWAQLGLITSLLSIVCWVGLFLWLESIVRGMLNHPY